MEWTKVEEQTPTIKAGENSVNVIVFCDNEVFETTYNKELGWCYPDCDDPYPYGIIVTHWQPLPAPPHTV